MENQPSSGDLIDKDRRYLWHPYSPVPTPVDPVPIAHAEGLYLTTLAGAG